MINHERFKELMELDVPKSSSTVMDLSGLSIAQLSSLRDDINDLLPDTGKMDLHRELATQYALIKEYQAEVLDNDETAPNQVAQVMNSTVAALGHLIKLQESLEREETLKKMETCFFEAVKLMPDDAKERFFEEYALLASKEGLR